MTLRPLALLLAIHVIAEADEIRLPSSDEVAELVQGVEPEGRILLCRGGLGVGAAWLEAPEIRRVLQALFEKNGFAPVDGFDAAAGMGFVIVPAMDPVLTRLDPGGKRMTNHVAPEIEIERARGGAAILVVGEIEYCYSLGGDAGVNKAEAVDRLIEDARRFLVWLQHERNLPACGASVESSEREESR